MRLIPLLCVVSALLIACRINGAEPAAPITIKGTDGKTFEGTVLALEKESVKVKRADGREFTIPLSRLTPETIAEVEKAARAKEPADKKAAPAGKKPAVAKPTKPEEIEIKVVVKCGEKVSATFEMKGDTVTKATVVKTPDDNTPHFDVDFKESDGTTTAVTKNSFPRTLRVRCLARSKGSKNWVEANIFPLYPGTMGGDTWDDAEELVFFDFKFTDEKVPD